ncbi:hypothetical protein MGYG_08881 [Nannizzia gypsea CBS 118893]|uniref:Uncharacterized protein n=1 Tax=Arthroderma gypseum (strain ATCC MYA-4604 / CBS 118893) TaxID=535722 RepID=E5R2T2_ARTGP|nr:hypothetical protein MGYG_08881 [Nannizzia gypsea CBS 118893]EFQ97066.1 hypothetical protein MGYG_08881 [Nannizzia gypsea CBS 118893]
MAREGSMKSILDTTTISVTCIHVRLRSLLLTSNRKRYLYLFKISHYYSFHGREQHLGRLLCSLSLPGPTGVQREGTADARPYSNISRTWHDLEIGSIDADIWGANGVLGVMLCMVMQHKSINIDDARPDQTRPDMRQTVSLLFQTEILIPASRVRLHPPSVGRAQTGYVSAEWTLNRLHNDQRTPPTPPHTWQGYAAGKQIGRKHERTKKEDGRRRRDERCQPYPANRGQTRRDSTS